MRNANIKTVHRREGYRRCSKTIEGNTMRGVALCIVLFLIPKIRAAEVYRKLELGRAKRAGGACSLPAQDRHRN